MSIILRLHRDLSGNRRPHARSGLLRSGVLQRLRSMDRFWRLALVSMLVALLPIAQQLAVICCLPCALHETVAQAQTDAPSPIRDAQHDQAKHESTCQTCGSCASLLAMALGGAPIVTAGSQAVPHSAWSLIELLADTVVPFASRAPPISMT